MDVLKCRFAQVAVDLCPCDNNIPYETVFCKGEGGSLTALVWSVDEAVDIGGRSSCL